MTNYTGPTRFDPRNIFLGRGWNIFVVLVGSLALWASLAQAAIAYHAPGWGADVLWFSCVAIIAHAVWTSARRLWAQRKSAKSG